MIQAPMFVSVNHCSLICATENWVHDLVSGCAVVSVEQRWIVLSLAHAVPGEEGACSGVRRRGLPTDKVDACRQARGEYDGLVDSAHQGPPPHSETYGRSGTRRPRL